mmetsp:Transcript_79171/g.205743  ORF Transcript_79171/g.205743 Transcript_79171/m.205743 type:complete len:217 (-) Transcript_79171:939-1589(-)
MLRRTRLQQLLHSEFTILRSAQIFCLTQDLADNFFGIPAGFTFLSAMLHEAQHGTTSEAMLGHRHTVAHKLRSNEADVLRWQHLHSLPDHKVRIVMLQSFDNVPLQASQQVAGIRMGGLILLRGRALQSGCHDLNRVLNPVAGLTASACEVPHLSITVIHRSLTRIYNDIQRLLLVLRWPLLALGLSRITEACSTRTTLTLTTSVWTRGEHRRWSP